MNITNDHNLPSLIVDALTTDTYSKGNSNRSVTQLIDAPRIGVLFTEHEDSIDKDAVEFLWTRFGTSVHNMFEDAVESKENLITEERLYVKSNDWVISGAIDLQEITPEGRIISDYKVTSVWAVIYSKKSWHHQLNAYAWLVRHATGDAVKQLRIIAIMRDWKANDAKKGGNYPQSPIEIIDIPLASDINQDAYMDQRIKLHQEAEFAFLCGDPLPLCSDEERWRKPDSWAIHKTSSQRALRVFDNKDDAKRFAREARTYKKNRDEKVFIRTRSGTATRCQQNWCKVAPFCDQFLGELERAAK